MSLFYFYCALPALCSMRVVLCCWAQVYLFLKIRIWIHLPLWARFLFWYQHTHAKCGLAWSNGVVQWHQHQHQHHHYPQPHRPQHGNYYGLMLILLFELILLYCCCCFNKLNLPNDNHYNPLQNTNKIQARERARPREYNKRVEKRNHFLTVLPTNEYKNDRVNIK